MFLNRNRFALTRGLTALILSADPFPLRNFSRLLLPDPVNSDRGKQFNIFAAHSRFDKAMFQKYLGKDAIFVGTIRHPLKRFQSAINFFGYNKILKSNDNLVSAVKVFLRNPKKFNLSGDLSHIPNRILYQYGYKGRMDARSLDKFLSELRELMPVMMIQDNFDESLILLKRKLRLKMEDILYLPSFNNTYVEKSHALWSDKVSFENWSKGDVYFYRKVIQDLKAEMDAEEGFDEELKVFKAIKTMVSDYCSIIIKQQLEQYGFLEIPEERFQEILRMKPLQIPKLGRWSDAFTVDPHRCMFIGINPFALHVSLGLKNHPYFCEQLMRLPPEKRSMASINLESVHIPKDNMSQAIFPDIFCSTPDSRFHVPHKIWRYGFLYSNTVGFTKMQI